MIITKYGASIGRSVYVKVDAENNSAQLLTPTEALRENFAERIPYVHQSFMNETERTLAHKAWKTGSFNA